MPQVAEARPPYVTFEVRPEEDREATIRDGQYRSKDVDYAIITPHGSKDRLDRRAEEWLAQAEQQAREGFIPEDWARRYRERYDYWKKGQEMPESGTSVRNWPALSPSQVKLCLDAGFRAVEDLAAANEEGIRRLGMGGQALKMRAVEWLRAAEGGKGAEQVAALKAENADLRNSVESLQQKFEEAMAKLNSLTPPETSRKL